MIGIALLAFLAAAPAALAAPPARAPDPAVLRLEIGPERIVCGVTAPARAATAPSPGAAGDGAAASGPRPRPLSLLIWFHGGMRSGNREKGLEAHRQALAFVDADRFVLASASAFAGRDWLGPGAIRTVDALIDTLHARYPLGDDLRLLGVSDGCLGVIRYAAAGRWHAGRKVLVSSLPQLAVTEAGIRGDSRLLQGRWDFLQGGRDRLFPAQVVVPFLRDWERLHPDAHLHFFPEGEHDFAYYAEHAAGLLRSLLASPASEPRPKKPKNIQSRETPQKSPTRSGNSKG